MADEYWADLSDTGKQIVAGIRGRLPGFVAPLTDSAIVVLWEAWIAGQEFGEIPTTTSAALWCNFVFAREGWAAAASAPEQLAANARLSGGVNAR